MKERQSSKKIIITITAVLLLIITAMVWIGISARKRANEEQVVSFQIETPFMTLEYPMRWEGKIQTRWIGNDQNGRMVFSTKLDRQEVVELFKIHFNEDAQIPVGVLNTEEKKDVYIGFSFAEISFDESWTEDEKNELYAMQEDVNFIIQQLSKDERFKKVQ